MTFTRLRYHIITATRGRRPWLTQQVREVAYEEIRRSAECNGGKILVMGGIEDHVHLLAAISPAISVANFIKFIKQDSSRKVSATLRHREFRWQVGYTAFTVNPWDMDELYRYILNQESRHRRGRERSSWEMR